MKKTISLFFIFIFVHSLQAHYTPLSCEGERPELFKGDYFNLAKDISNGNNGKTYNGSNVAENFAWQSSYLLKYLLFSGSVIFGDLISTKLNEEIETLNSIIKFNSKPQVFLLKSTIPNAFATASGAIFITTALISYMDNYAQLVYVLCHEIAHLEKDHIYENFIKKAKVDMKKNRLTQRSNYWFSARAMSDYYEKSREHEFEADKEGLQIFGSLRFDQNDAIAALRNIKKSNKQAFYQIKRDTFALASAYLPSFKVDYFEKKEGNNLDSHDEGEVDVSTHPNINDRIMNLEKNNTFSFSVDTSFDGTIFSEMKKIAHNETIYQQFLEHKYFEIVATYWTENDKFFDKDFLQNLYGRSLYMILKLRLEKIKREEASNLKEEPGKLYQIDDILQPKNPISLSYPFVKYFNTISISDLWYLTTEALLADSTDNIDEPSAYLIQCLEIKDSCVGITDNKDSIETVITSLTRNFVDNNLVVFPESDTRKTSHHTFVFPYIATADSWFMQSNFNIEKRESNLFNIIDSAQHAFGIESTIHSTDKLDNTDDLRNYLDMSQVIQYRLQLGFVDNLVVELPGLEDWSNTNIHISEISYFHHLKRFHPVALLFWYFLIIYYAIPNKQKTISHYEIDLNFPEGTIENLHFRKHYCKRDSKRRINKIIWDYYFTHQSDFSE